MQRATASTITDIQLDDLYERLATAAELARTSGRSLREQLETIHRLCAGEITPGQARIEIRGE
ncbi:hypothetical protein ABT095_20845 [Kitasatospora sp. NPDC002227]|uniref:hypothetical protein n=1 Tax=Kitasatospora sp. NPDC002227 TaxID=3154773 RepID=UPI003319932B